MEQRTLFLTTYALARILKEFGKRFGLDDDMADVTAQVHMQQSATASTWSTFIVTNCTNCEKIPPTCDFLNPKEHNCTGDSTPEDVQASNAMIIEMGKLTVCPAFRLKSQ